MQILRLKDSIVNFHDVRKGEILFADDKNCNFEFQYPVRYINNRDCLITFDGNSINEEKFTLTYVTNDFGFVIFENQLEGWILRNASNYIYPLQGERGENANDSSDILNKYFSALNLWEENEENIIELTNLLEVVKTRNDSVSLAVKESIDNIL